MKRRKKNPPFDKAVLRKDIARADRAATKAKIAKLKGDAKAACAKGRANARDKRAAMIEVAKAEGRAARAAAKASCSSAKAPYEEERKHRADLRRIERANKKPSIASAKVARTESDDEVRQNIAPELVPLFERVKRSIKGSPRTTRTEAFLKYVEEHPREQFAASEDATDALIADLERRQRTGTNPKKGRAPNPTPGDWARGLALWMLLGSDRKLAVSKAGVPGEISADYVRAALEDARRMGAKSETDQARHAAQTLAVWLREPWLYEEKHGRGRKNPETFKSTHGGELGDWNEKRVHVPDPRKPLTVMGRLRRIVYDADKGSGATIYTHTFGREYRGAEERGAPKESRMPWLTFTPDGGLVVAGGHYTVKPEGIVG